jgi:hypothetical protein
LADGSIDENLNPLTGNVGFNALVRAVTVNANELYVGGDFTTFKGGAANRIAKINLDTGLVDTVFNPTRSTK